MLLPVHHPDPLLGRALAPLEWGGLLSQTESECGAQTGLTLRRAPALAGLGIVSDWYLMSQSQVHVGEVPLPPGLLGDRNAFQLTEEI